MAASAQEYDGNVSLVLSHSDEWLQQCWDFAQERGFSWKRHRLHITDSAGAEVSPERQPFLDASDFPLSVQFVPRVPEVAIHIDWRARTGCRAGPQRPKPVEHLRGTKVDENRRKISEKSRRREVFLSSLVEHGLWVPSGAIEDGRGEEPDPLLVDWGRREGLPLAQQHKVVFLGPKGALRRRRESRAPMKPSAPTWALPRQQEALAVAEVLRRAPVRGPPPCAKAPAVLPSRCARIRQPGGHKATSRGNFARR